MLISQIFGVNYPTVSLSMSIIGRAKRAPHWGVQSRFHMIYIYICVGMSVVS